MSVFPFRIENITVNNAPILKNFYWDYMDLTSLNNHLASKCDIGVFEHFMEIPPMPVQSPPIEIVLHVRNTFDENVYFQFKRIKLCECVVQETRVGINTYKKLYHCPHREVVKVDLPKTTVGITSKAMSYITLNVSYNMIGEIPLRFLWSTSKGYKLFLNINVTIIGFDPVKCVLTRSLFPVSMKEFPCFVQPIWIFNFHREPLFYEFLTEEHDLTILTPCMEVARNSIAPLLVKYRPTKLQAELVIILKFGGMLTPFVVKGIGYMKNSDKNKLICPSGDLICDETPMFEVTRCGDHRKAIMVNNYDNECVDFKWCQYYFPGYFKITINPEIILCKGKSSVRCSVHIETTENPAVFTNIQIPCQIHRPITKSEKIARLELHEVESIDDDRLKKDTFLRKINMKVDLQINGISPLKLYTNNQIDGMPDDVNYPITPEVTNFDRNVLEKIFHKYIYSEDFEKLMKGNIKH